MGWIFIDTHQRGVARYGVLESVREPRVSEAEGRGSEALAALRRALAPSKTRGAIGVAVVAGPGPFSSVRGGVLVANLMARIRRLPLVSVPAGLPDAEVRDGLFSGRWPAAGYVPPEYDSEPNITMKKI